MPLSNEEILGFIDDNPIAHSTFDYVFTDTLLSAAAVPSGKPRLVSRMGIQQYLDVGDEWRPREWTGNEGQVSLSFEYGDACDKTCRARNDTFGHYTCSDQGDKICLSGWSGSYCEKRKSSFIFVCSESALARFSFTLFPG